MTWHRGIFVNWLCRMCHVVLRSAQLNLLTVRPGKPGKYGYMSFARAIVKLWNSLRGERAATIIHCNIEVRDYCGMFEKYHKFRFFDVKV